MATKSVHDFRKQCKGVILVARGRSSDPIRMAGHLSGAGYRCEIVSEGSQAVHAALNRHYDLALLDCEMAEMTGLEATREIRQEEARRTTPARLPIMLVTPTMSEAHLHNCRAAGADVHVTRSFDPATLIQMVGVLVRRSGRAIPKAA